MKASRRRSRSCSTNSAHAAAALDATRASSFVRPVSVKQSSSYRRFNDETAKPCQRSNGCEGFLTHEREDLLIQYERAVRAFNEATERSRTLRGGDFYEAMLEVDRLHEETRRLEQALAAYDEAMR